jgi:hypothetical protein
MASRASVANTIAKAMTLSMILVRAIRGPGGPGRIVAISDTVS